MVVAGSSGVTSEYDAASCQGGQPRRVPAPERHPRIGRHNNRTVRSPRTVFFYGSVVQWIE